ncbi:hypothetical protein ACQUFY_15210 [Robbsia andropogonis]
MVPGVDDDGTFTYHRTAVRVTHCTSAHRHIGTSAHRHIGTSARA